MNIGSFSRVHCYILGVFAKCSGTVHTCPAHRNVSARPCPSAPTKCFRSTFLRGPGMLSPAHWWGLPDMPRHIVECQIINNPRCMTKESEAVSIVLSSRPITAGEISKSIFTSFVAKCVWMTRREISDRPCPVALVGRAHLLRGPRQ